MTMALKHKFPDQMFPTPQSRNGHLAINQYYSKQKSYTAPYENIQANSSNFSSSPS